MVTVIPTPGTKEQRYISASKMHIFNLKTLSADVLDFFVLDADSPFLSVFL